MRRPDYFEDDDTVWYKEREATLYSVLHQYTPPMAFIGFTDGTSTYCYLAELTHREAEDLDIGDIVYQFRDPEVHGKIVSFQTNLQGDRLNALVDWRPKYGTFPHTVETLRKVRVQLPLFELPDELFEVK